MYKVDFEDTEEPEIKLPTFVGSWRKHRSSFYCFIDYTKAFTAWITTNCRKFLKRWEYQTTLPVS